MYYDLILIEIIFKHASTLIHKLISTNLSELQFLPGIVNFSKCSAKNFFSEE